MKADERLNTLQTYLYTAGTFLHTSVELSPNPVQVGVDVTFTCTATTEGSTDPATFQWTDSDGNAVTTSDEVIISSESNSSTLQFNPAQESQTGEYNCQAVVLSLSATNSAQLEVTGKPHPLLPMAILRLLFLQFQYWS